MFALAGTRMMTVNTKHGQALLLQFEMRIWEHFKNQDDNDNFVHHTNFFTVTVYIAQSTFLKLCPKSI
jgi:hypothetical protein